MPASRIDRDGERTIRRGAAVMSATLAITLRLSVP